MRGQIFLRLLLLCLLLAASPFNHFTANVQAIPAVHVKLRTLRPSTMPHSGHVIPSWDEDKRTRKSPSGPNPIGNHQPPSKT
ncbi:CLAVATA3/ESR (CLE)-related protein 46-like [Neltuma alba]|uniref:CLAVATA3/ESR (CLE)-related protein 46-like n=1 Tax=Neltuma alba TaxID=207710 RepID=UPI0010A5062E|nr:CLAVATA3/ESR (CLE)-related protein 46-like [Prosopis alba]XP_028788666.1 CLAVATA3/ESR (CLE)-related protein 46-like [Prosopis alba]